MDENAVKTPETPTGYEEMTKFIWECAEKNERFSFSYLGATVLGKAIPVISLGEGERTFLYVGAHHAAEHITSSLLLTFAGELARAADEGDTVFGVNTADLLKTSRIIIIPMLNCDGVGIELRGAEAGGILRDRLIRTNGGDDFTRWQANARGVDLNHNYGAGFYEYKKLERELGICGGAPSRYSGEYPESEPEIGALCNYLRFTNDVKGCLTLHTQGEEVYFGGGAGASEEIGKKVAAAARYELSRPEGPAAYGGMTDWVTESLGIPSFTVECGRGENPLPSSDLPVIFARIAPLLFTFPAMFE